MLTKKHLDLILESLRYTKRNFENTGIAPHGNYPSYQFKCDRLKEVDDVIAHVRAERDAKKEGKE